MRLFRNMMNRMGTGQAAPQQPGKPGALPINPLPMKPGAPVMGGPQGLGGMPPGGMGGMGGPQGLGGMPPGGMPPADRGGMSGMGGMGGVGMKKGGMTASKRADGIAQRGKTRGKVC